MVKILLTKTLKYIPIDFCYNWGKCVSWIILLRRSTLIIYLRLCYKISFLQRSQIISKKSNFKRRKTGLYKNIIITNNSFPIKKKIKRRTIIKRILLNLHQRILKITLLYSTLKMSYHTRLMYLTNIKPFPLTLLYSQSLNKRYKTTVRKVNESTLRFHALVPIELKLDFMTRFAFEDFTRIVYTVWGKSGIRYTVWNLNI